jgi:hypothetical protein
MELCSGSDASSCSDVGYGVNLSPESGDGAGGECKWIAAQHKLWRFCMKLLQEPGRWQTKQRAYSFFPTS